MTPFSDSPTLWPLSHTSAAWRAPSNSMNTRLPAASAGRLKSLRYHTTESLIWYTDTLKASSSFHARGRVTLVRLSPISHPALKL